MHTACLVPSWVRLQGKPLLRVPCAHGWAVSGFSEGCKNEDTPKTEDLFWVLAAPAHLLKEQLKDSLPGSDFFPPSPFQDRCLPWPQG